MAGENCEVFIEQGGGRLVVQSNGTIKIESGTSLAGSTAITISGDVVLVPVVVGSSTYYLILAGTIART